MSSSAAARDAVVLPWSSSGFPAAQVFCVFDYETYSEADLKEVGAFEYSVHSSTEIICAAWRIGTYAELRAGTTATKVWTDLEGDGIESASLAPFYAALTNPDVLLVAHNSLFEMVITRNVFGPKYMRSKARELAAIPPSRFVCTAALSSALALPRNLEGAASALSLPVQKDMAGRKLVLKWCKPRKPSKNNPSTRHTGAAELRRLMGYCATDVDTEVALFCAAPPLTPLERRVWTLDQTINLRGFSVDRALVNTILDIVDDEIAATNAATAELTGGEIQSATEVAAVVTYIAEKEQYYLPDLKKETVESALRDEQLPYAARKLLEYRQIVSRTSTAKFDAFEARSRFDGRLRDILVYHTASTGRWGGAGVQPQNFPRGIFKGERQLLTALDVIRSGDRELVQMIYGDVMPTLSSCLRGMIVAPAGYTLDVADYSSIEARVLFWVAEHEAGLRAFRDKRPIYEEMAAAIFAVPLAKIGADSYERFLGKSAVLGCGFGMGAPKFQATCEAQGQPVSLELADRAVKSYRHTHAPVVRLWKAVEAAAVAAVQAGGGRSYEGGRVVWTLAGDFLWARLPSGRRLAYYGPEIRHEPTPWGEPRPVLYHWGVDGRTRKWARSKTYGGRLVENIVQAIARDLMAEAMLRIEDAGPWRLVLSVHDELVAERRLGGVGTIGDFCRLMSETPEWAAGCPVEAKGWTATRYRK